MEVVREVREVLAMEVMVEVEEMEVVEPEEVAATVG